MSKYCSEIAGKIIELELNYEGNTTNELTYYVKNKVLRNARYDMTLSDTNIFKTLKYYSVLQCFSNFLVHGLPDYKVRGLPRKK